MSKRYLFHDRYQMHCVEHNGDQYWWLTDIKAKTPVSLFCFKLCNPDEKLVPAYIDLCINKYIAQHEALAQAAALQSQKETVNVITDDGNHFTYVKTLTVGHIYDCLHIHENVDSCDPASTGSHSRYVHRIVDFDEYTLPQLDEIVRCYGYTNLVQFFCEAGATVPIINNIIDFWSTDWIQIAETVAAMIVEQDEGRILSKEQANRLFYRFID